MATDARDLRSIYDELRVVARALLRREPYAHTLESMELVHQAWIRLLSGDLRELAENEPEKVVALAVTQMRRELIDHARRRKAAKRPTSAVRVELRDIPGLSHEQPEVLLAVDALLDELETTTERIRNGARKAQVARFALYGGLSESEIATLTGIPKSTVGSDVRFVKAWLATRLDEGDA
ncbi:MAG: ECF-type sigma factor [Myxococcota bacterium]